MESVFLYDARRDFDDALYHLRSANELFKNVSKYIVANNERESNGVSSEYITKMAVMHSVMSGYTSIENGIRRIMSAFHEPEPTGGRWHEDLIKRAGSDIPGLRQRMFSDNLIEHLHILRGFRNIATRNYNNFSMVAAEAAFVSIQFVVDNLYAELNNFASIYEDCDKPSM